MSTLMIKDLARTEALDAQAMADVKGGTYYFPWLPVYGYEYSSVENLSFAASQSIGQVQNVVNNNGNNVAFASGISSFVTPVQSANNNINFGAPL
jgi:hypothetical protein